MDEYERENGVTREGRLTSVFVELADTLISEFDVIDFLHTLADRAVELLQVDAAGIMLADQRGRLRALASSTEQARVLELIELQQSEGPCLDCFRAGRAVVNADLGEHGGRWPRFGAAARQAGYRTISALPLRLRSEVIGAMNLFRTESAELSDEDLALGQGLCDVATIGLLQERAVRYKEVLAEQLQGALNSRILIEQAKGVLAERSGLDVDEAFSRMRAYSRRARLPLRAVAADVIEGSIDPHVLQQS